VAHLAQYDAGIEIRRQALIYPSLDYTMTLPSVEENGTGYLLEKEGIAWYFDNYFQHCENRKTASPLFMEFSKRLPRTLVITAEFCPLRDEGIAYAAKVKTAGLHVEHLHLDDMIHAFMNMENLAKTACATAYRCIAAFLNRG
jgi:acetyl esterase